MASPSTVDKTTFLSLPRSTIQNSTGSHRSDESDEGQLSALNSMRNVYDGIEGDISTSDVPALPFVVCHSIIVGDPARNDFYHLFPGDFPVIEDDIGHGASFIVQKAKARVKRTQSGEEVAVALKRIRPSNPKTRQSFRGVMSDLICLVHPILRRNKNIITLLGLGWETSPSGTDERLWPYLILEYSTHGTLADLQASKILPYSTKKQLCLDIASGLDAVHFSNIVHGDIKSENVLIFDKESGGLTAKLSDFGFATLDLDFHAAIDGKKMSMREHRAKAYLSTGTHPWTSPEFGRVVPWAEAFSSDVYSWGLLVWRVHVDGQNPFTVYRTTFESLGRLTGFEQEGNAKNWKNANLVLPAARSWALQTPQAGYLINDAFEHSLGLQTTSRNLRKAFLPWMVGRRWYVGYCPTEVMKAN
jgi:serine/threonine protein kinase